MPLHTITKSVTRILGTVCVLMTCALANPSAGNEIPPTVLEFHRGDFVRGKLLGIEDGQVEWDCEFFSEPFTFPLGRVAGMKRATEPDMVGEGEFVIELTNSRDILFGDLLAIDKDTIAVRSNQCGPLKLRRDAVRRISRNDEDGRLYPVPTRLDEWNKSSDDHWRSEGNTIVSFATAATLYADVNLPSKAIIEVELAWNGLGRLNPGFGLHFGTNEQLGSLESAFSIEVWGRQLVAQRRNSTLADVAALGSTASGSCHFFVYIDQNSGQMIVHDASGKRLGQIKVPPADSSARIHSGITLVNRKGNVHLEQLHIRGWSGLKAGTSAQAGGIAIALEDDVQTGNDIRVSNGKVALKSGDDVRTFDLNDVLIVNLPSGSSNAEQQVSATWQDGTRISGDLLSATHDDIVMQSYLASAPISLPLAGLRGLWFGKKKVGSRAAPTDRRAGTLELMDTRMKGWLVEGMPDKESTGSCLVWQAAEAQAASPLKHDVYGRILYVEPPAPANVSRPSVSARQQQMVLRLGAQRGRRAAAHQLVKARNEKLAGQAVHLRSGDTIPCKVTAIDKEGIHIESDLTESTSIPHDHVKAAQLTRTIAMPRLANAKRQRLLTLPRMQRNIPPQHLLFSPKGDVLRGSILSMGELELDLELRLDPHRIPRDRVAAIVWLHEDEFSDGTENKVEKGEDVAQGGNDDVSNEIQVQVIGSSGSRFSFFAQSFSDQTIHGHSGILKTVHASVDDIDQLLIGGFIRRAARSLPYHRWRLTSARDPKFVTDGDDGSLESNPGTESNLVGAPAPPIKLKMLDGVKVFQLSDHLDHCVVLDFWASWCGPCLQVMPQVEQVVSEFAADDVRLFAINLEESAEQVRATLERRQLDLPVALDRDGVAAARYEATAIPQTVVIGPDGNVARVFVGSSRTFAEQLRAALTELTRPEE